MAFHDLREFMKACEDACEMVTIDKEVDWNLEVGAISRRICEIGAPMAHMTNIKGISNGASILGSPMSKGWQNDFARVVEGHVRSLAHADQRGTHHAGTRLRCATVRPFREGGRTGRRRLHAALACRQCRRGQH